MVEGIRSTFSRVPRLVKSSELPQNSIPFLFAAARSAAYQGETRFCEAVSVCGSTPTPSWSISTSRSLFSITYSQTEPNSSAEEREVLKKGQMESFAPGLAACTALATRSIAEASTLRVSLPMKVMLAGSTDM